MKRSDNGGLTWSPLLPTPANWPQARNCPSLYRLADPTGRYRLFVFAARGPDGFMQEAHSDDEGQTWTPMTSTGLACIMPFCSIVPIDGGRRLLGQTNIKHPGVKDENSNLIAQSISEDGGLTWKPWTIALDLPGYSPSEPCLIRSPDGKELLSLTRENARRAGALFMTSRDEGKTWSDAQVTAPGLFWRPAHGPLRLGRAPGGLILATWEK